jgi:hypothetical protein
VIAGEELADAPGGRIALQGRPSSFYPSEYIVQPNDVQLPFFGTLGSAAITEHGFFGCEIHLMQTRSALRRFWHCRAKDADLNLHHVGSWRSGTPNGQDASCFVGREGLVERTG